MTPEERARFVFEVFISGYLGDRADKDTKDWMKREIAEHVRQSENDALEQAARLAGSFFDRYDEGTQCAKLIGDAIRRLKHEGRA